MVSAEGATAMENDPATDEARIEEMIRGFLALQARTAIEENRPLCRGVHAKGVCARAVFEVFDVVQGRDAALAARLAKGIYAYPGTYPATVRFSNSEPNVHSDSRPDVRGMAFCVQLTPSVGEGAGARQDYSMQSSPALPFNDVRSLMLYAKVFGDPNQAMTLQSLPFRDQLAFAQTMVGVMRQSRQPVRPYQQLRYWSCTPFRHGSQDIVKYSAWPAAENSARPLARRNPNALRDELIRHLDEDATMSSFDFGLQFLDVERLTYQGKQRDAEFWIENAAVEWPEAEAPFHRVARLTLLPRSVLGAAACDSVRINVGRNTMADCAPLGNVNRVRAQVVAASQDARRAVSRCDADSDMPEAP
jgi:hypothetical protein